MALGPEDWESQHLGQPSPAQVSPAQQGRSGQSSPRTATCLRAGLPGRAGHPEKGALAGQPGRSPAARTTASPSPPKRARPSAQCRDGTVPSVTRRFNWTSPGMLRACGHRLQVGIHSNRSSVETHRFKRKCRFTPIQSRRNSFQSYSFASYFQNRVF